MSVYFGVLPDGGAALLRRSAGPLLLTGLVACAADAAPAGRRDDEAQRASPEPGEEVPDCLEHLEEIDEARAAARGISLKDAYAISAAEYQVPLTWADATEAVFFLRSEMPTFSWVTSSENPAVQREEVLHCEDHLRIQARISLGARPRELEMESTSLSMRVDDGGRALGSVTLTAAQLPHYRPEVADDECFLSAQVDFVLDPERGLSGTIRHTVARAACDRVRPNTGVSPRQAATFNGAGDPDCTLPKQVESLRANESVDCGVVRADAAPDAVASARQCVLDALAAGNPFHVIAWSQGTDSSVGTGIVSGGAGQQPLLVHYDSDPTGGSGVGASIWTRPCATLAPNDANPSCLQDGHYQLCLRCDDPASGERTCRGPAERHPYHL